MEQHVSIFTIWLNQLLGKPVAALLAALHITSTDPNYPIPNHVVMELLLFVLAAIFFLWLRSRLSVENPGGTQQCMEGLITNSMGVGVRDLLEDIGGHGAERYLPVLGTVGMFVLLSNLISVIPNLDSPTASPSVPLACAAIIFIYYNYAGIAKLGALGHVKHFAGPVPALAWLIFPVEVISHSARLLSLTVRLWANMLVSEALYSIFLGLSVSLFIFVTKLSSAGYITAVVPLLVPPAFILLHVFVAIVQAFIFTILPVVYVSQVTLVEH
jgi:F-type H+-transporting ATPase subunit a